MVDPCFNQDPGSGGEGHGVHLQLGLRRKMVDPIPSKTLQYCTLKKKRKTCSLLQQQLLGVQHLPCFFWIVLQFLILTPHSMPEVRAHHYILLVANPHHPIFKPPFWSWNPKPFAGFKSPFCIYELYRMWNFPSSHHLGVSRNWATQKRSRFQDKPHGLGWCWGSVLGNPSRKAPLRFYLLPSGYLT